MAFNTEKVKLTPEGGIAVLLMATNSAIRLGEVVHVVSGSDNKVEPIIEGVPDPIGVAYSATAGSENIWVTVSGVATVLFNTNTAAGQLARGYVASEAGYESGCALAEDVPKSPFATDKHFYEIGHILDTVTMTAGYALAKCILHFN